MTAAPPRLVEVARLHGPDDVRVDREPLADATPGAVLLRVTAVGLCGSDLLWYDTEGIGDTRIVRPLVLGHRFADVIADGERTGARVAPLVSHRYPLARAPQAFATLADRRGLKVVVGSAAPAAGKAP